MKLAPLQLKNILREHTDKPVRVTKRNSSSLLTLLPSLVLGLWTLWIYVSVGRLQQSLAMEQAALTVAEAKEARVAATHELSIEALTTPDRYRGTFSVDIENTSRKRLEVSWVVFETYIGTLADSVGESAVLCINEPPKRELNITEPGVVEWRHQSSRGFLYPGSKRLKYTDFASEKYYRVGGGLTKSLAPGDRAAYTMPLIVSAPPDRWVAVVVILGLDGAQEGDGVFYYSDWVELASARVSSIASETATERRPTSR